MLKKIGIVIIGLIIIFASCFITNLISKKRASEIYDDLENRYINIEKSNRKLAEINGKLENNNIRLTAEINGINTDIRRANIIVGEFEDSISGARDTVERIEITIGFIEEIIGQLPDEIVILEENNYY